MKKFLLKFLFALSIVIGATVTTQAQKIFVKVRPKVVVTTRAAAPRRDYVWVDDEWAVRNGAYVQVAGHWIAPRRGFVWIPGHWVAERRGEYWIPGHWRRV